MHPTKLNVPSEVLGEPTFYMPVFELMSPQKVTVQSPPFLGVSKLVHAPFIEPLEPMAPPSYTHHNIANGVLKAFANRYIPSDQEAAILEEWLHKEFGKCMVNEPVDPLVLLERLDSKKAAGSYFRQVYGPLKGDFLKRWSPQQSVNILLDLFNRFSSIIDVFPKDELRPLDKMPRDLWLAQLCDIYAGMYLFAHQDDALVDAVLTHCSTIGIQTLGSQLLLMWKSLYQFDGANFHADVQQNDVRFTPYIQIVRNFRLRYESDPRRCRMIRRYYNKIYYGFINLFGNLLMVLCQKSGHWLTANDNSLHHFCIFALRAVRLGWTYEYFKSQVLAYLNADDLVYSTKNIEYYIDRLNETYNSVGFYLETPSLEPSPFWALQFLATTPTITPLHGYDFVLYRFRLPKLIESFNWDLRNSSPLNIFVKRCQLLILLFTHTEIFLSLRALVVSDYHRRVLTCPELRSPTALQLLRLILDDSRLLLLYTRAETRLRLH
jgi:hypothetical protein